VKQTLLGVTPETPWIRFGSKQLVASNDPDEMGKSIKYNTLIANYIMLQNIIDITDICHELQEEEYKITKEDVSYMPLYDRTS
jgi:hypothetical protein